MKDFQHRMYLYIDIIRNDPPIVTIIAYLPNFQSKGGHLVFNFFFFSGILTFGNKNNVSDAQ